MNWNKEKKKQSHVKGNAKTERANRKQNYMKREENRTVKKNYNTHLSLAKLNLISTNRKKKGKRNEKLLYEIMKYENGFI